MSKDTEQDVYIEIAGHVVYCLCKFEDGYLYSVTPYKEQNGWKRQERRAGDLMPFLHPDAINDLEADHAEYLKL